MALNRAWGGRADRGFLMSRLLAFVMTMTGGLLALASVAVTVLARSYGPGWPWLTSFVGKLSALLLTYVLFFLIYRFVPQAGVGSPAALRASLWGGSAWETAKYVFVWNLERTNLQAFYGPLAFAVALVLWAYVSSLALVFGALMVPVPKRRA
jgi:membrane protein/epoxyqueuosine reductase